jgi:cell division protein FtsL
MKGLKLRTVVGLFLLVLCAAGVLVAHVWKQNAYVRLSMSTVKIGKQKSQLQNDIALLEISVGGLRKLSRIEAMAKSRFGLEYGNAPVLVYLETGADEAVKAGKGGNAAEGKARMASASTKAPEIAQAGRSGGDGDAKGLEAGKGAWRIKGF